MIQTICYIVCNYLWSWTLFQLVDINNRVRTHKFITEKVTLFSNWLSSFTCKSVDGVLSLNNCKICIQALSIHNFKKSHNDRQFICKMVSGWTLCLWSFTNIELIFLFLVVFTPPSLDYHFVVPLRICNDSQIVVQATHMINR